MTEKVTKVSIQELQKMVREAVALQLNKSKQSASDRREKIKDDKEKSQNEGVQKITVEHLRAMVKEAISARLKENRMLRESMGEMPAEGDLVAFHGKTGYVVQVSGDKVAITRDGIKMQAVPLAGVQILATADDLNELGPDELDLLGKEMGYNHNVDPGEDPHTELERIESQLSGSNMLSGMTRKSLEHRKAELKQKLGMSDEMGEAASPLAEEPSEKPYDRHEHGYLAKMTWGQMPSEELWHKAMANGWHWKLGRSDREAFEVAMEVAGLNPHEAEAKMSTPEGMKVVVQALADCQSEDPEFAGVCERAENLASSIMDNLGFEWI